MQFLKLKTMNHLILILMTARRKGRKENPNKKITLKISKRRRHKREERMMTVTMMILKMIQEKKSSKKKKGGSDSEELDSEKEKNDLLEDLEVIDTGSIIKERRTRGKKIDFTGMDPYEDE